MYVLYVDDGCDKLHSAPRVIQTNELASLVLGTKTMTTMVYVVPCIDYTYNATKAGV